MDQTRLIILLLHGLFTSRGSLLTHFTPGKIWYRAKLTFCSEITINLLVSTINRYSVVNSSGKVVQINVVSSTVHSLIRSSHKVIYDLGSVIHVVPSPCSGLHSYNLSPSFPYDPTSVFCFHSSLPIFHLRLSFAANGGYLCNYATSKKCNCYISSYTTTFKKVQNNVLWWLCCSG